MPLITHICAHVQTKKTMNITQQLLLQLICAHTIHRSEGLNMDGLTFDPKWVNPHRLIYIGLSHVKHMKSWYLINKLQESNFSVSKKVVQEVQKLETNFLYKFQYHMHSESINNYFLISSLNTQRLSFHIQHIAIDHALMKSSILCFKETQTNMQYAKNMLSNNNYFLSM